MKRIPNVFLQIPDYNCFGCSPVNNRGLRLEFFSHEDGYCFARFPSTRDYSGYPGILHGGIASTLLDEVAFWAVFDSEGLFGLTASINLKFKNATPIGPMLLCKGVIKARRGRLVTISVSLIDEETGIVTVEGEAVYFLVTKENWEKVTGVPPHPSILEYLG